MPSARKRALIVAISKSQVLLLVVTAIRPMEEGGKSTSLGPCPISMAAVQTAAIIASKTTGAPLQSAPKLLKPGSSLVSNDQFELPVNYPKNESLEMIKQSNETGMPGNFLPLAPKEVSCHLQSTLKQGTTATTNLKHKDTTDSSKDNMILRSGKWTAEEEHYAKILIGLFEEGRVDEFEDNDQSNSDKNTQEKRPPKFKITNGMTLRAFLSRKLFCSPMRISKKFAGKGIGKLVYMSQSPGAYQQHLHRLSNSSIANVNYGNGASLRSATHIDERNRLKQAESNFLRIAFPTYDSLNVVGYLNLAPSSSMKSSKN